MALLPTLAADGGQRPLFHATTRKILVVASVTRNNAPVAGLQASDFLLTDNGVRQRLDVVPLKDTPLDISILVDTSGSTAGVLDTMVDSISRIPTLLKPPDRFRILTIGLSVFHTLGWTQAGQPIHPVTIYPMAGISLVYDGIYAAATHVEGSGRRHLVVAMTDGEDACSVITPEQVRQLGRRTEAVVHWVRMSGRSAVPIATAGPACGGPGRFDPVLLTGLVDDTGGTVRDGYSAPDIAQALRGVLDDSRTSYLLSFTPEGASSTGWHKLSVKVPSGRFTVRARSGYFADQEPSVAGGRTQ